jgi:CheY-like chemotaxis protein
MTFQSLLVSQDDDAIALLNPVLSGFGIAVASCAYSDAVTHLSDEKFDAVIVDFDDTNSAALVLQNLYQSSSGNRAVTVALLSDRAKVRNVLGQGAHFVLYKPISAGQAEASLRAATALIKRERRSSFRIPIQVPIQLAVQGGPELEGILLDLSETGMDVLAAQPLAPAVNISATFTLPQGQVAVAAQGQVAWANPNGQAGVRFVDLTENMRSTLSTWVSANAPDILPMDPEPVTHCKLSDLSLGGCYVETESPFPERSGITLCLKAEEMEVHAEGKVRVMHPSFGMGIEFASRTSEDRDHVAKFIEFLTSRPGTMPALEITPRALTASDGGADTQGDSGAESFDDPLLELLQRHDSLSQEEFLKELRQQRGSEEVAPA